MFRYETLKPYCKTLVYSKFQDLTVNKTILKRGLFLGHNMSSTCQSYYPRPQRIQYNNVVK